MIKEIGSDTGFFSKKLIKGRVKQKEAEPILVLVT
jgi:hypothetical protein